VSIKYSSQGREYFTIAIPDNWRINVGSEVDTADIPEGEPPQARLITAMPGEVHDCGLACGFRQI